MPNSRAEAASPQTPAEQGAAPQPAPDAAQLLATLDLAVVVVDAGLRVQSFTPRARELFKLNEGDLGCLLADLPASLDPARLAEDAAQVVQTGSSLEREAAAGGGLRLVRLLPYGPAADDDSRAGGRRASGVVLNFVDTGDLKPPSPAGPRSVAQQQAVAGLGALALGGATLGELYDAAAQAVCELLDVEFCRVLELTPAGDALLLRAGTGWDAELIGRALYPIEAGSHDAYVLAHSEPTVTVYWPDERRFPLPPMHRQHGIVSGINARLQGRAGVYGYLGAQSRRRRDFTPEDVAFVQSLANLLGQAIGQAQAEEAARVSEERFRLALRTAPVALFSQDRDLRITWLHNADPAVVAAAAAHGGLVGQSERVLYAGEEEWEASAAFKRRVMETRRAGRAVMSATFLGRRRVFDVTAEPTFDAAGNVNGVVCASMDITELKEIQDRLEESEQRFRTALQNSPITVFQQDRDLRYTWVYNPLADGNQTPEEIIGHTDQEVLPDKDEAARLEEFKRRVIETGRPQRSEFVLTLDRPHYLDVTAEPLRDDHGAVIGLTAAAFDLTELREARAALAESEELRRLALEAADLGTLAYDLGTGRLFADARCRAIFGVTADAPFSVERVFSLIHPDDLGQAQAAFARATAPHGQAAFAEELRIVRPDGALRWVNVLGRAHHAAGPEQRVEHLVATIMDVTGRRQGEEALREWNAALERSVAARTAELQQRNEELDRFAYVASHDLKSPLRGIRILAQWVQEDAAGALPGTAREHLEKLVGRVDRMERLLDDLLLYSRAGRTRGDVEELEVAAFVGDVVETLEAPHGFSIAVQEGSVQRIRAERVPLELALRNLIGNAIKHHHRPAQGRAWVGVADAGSAWLVTVKDDGPGIDPAFHTRIFDMFQTLRPRDQVEGSGMGLALVKKLAEARGGRVEVQSGAGGGAEFRLWWPKDSDQ